MRRLTILLTAVLFCAVFGVWSCGECRGSESIDYRVRRCKGLIHIKQRIPKGSVSGSLPPKDVVADKSEVFYKALSILPLKFIRASGIKNVTFVSHPKLKGKEVGGVACGENIYISVECCNPHVIYHELFHVFDEKPQDRRWTRINHRRFLYTGSQYYPSHLKGRKERRRQDNLKQKTFDPDFVSGYAMSNEQEDRAETFAAMLVEGERFLQRTEKSPVLKKKMEYIIKVTRYRLETGFWERHLHLKEGI